MLERIAVAACFSAFLLNACATNTPRPLMVVDVATHGLVACPGSPSRWCMQIEVVNKGSRTAEFGLVSSYDGPYVRYDCYVIQRRDRRAGKDKSWGPRLRYEPIVDFFEYPSRILRVRPHKSGKLLVVFDVASDRQAGDSEFRIGVQELAGEGWFFYSDPVDANGKRISDYVP